MCESDEGREDRVNPLEWKVWNHKEGEVREKLIKTMLIPIICFILKWNYHKDLFAFQGKDLWIR